MCARKLQYSAIPSQIIVAYGDQPNGRIHGSHCGSVTFEVLRVSLRVAVPTHPRAPDLVSNLPVLDVVGCRVAVRGTHSAVPGIGRPVGVFDPRCGLRSCGATTFHVDGDRWLRAKVAAELYEF